MDIERAAGGTRPAIHGRGVDAEGRCTHYGGTRDVVGNLCVTCGKYWACHRCHAEACDHPFGRAPLDAPAVVCGVCGHLMNYPEYSATEACPACGHGFNPGCSLHAHLYFRL